MITRSVVEKRLLSYLNRRSTLAELVDLSENMMMEGEFDLQDVDLLTDILARLGLADVRVFGLSWDGCYEFLSRLGYRVQVRAVAV
jgi:hypothetical protein